MVPGGFGEGVRVRDWRNEMCELDSVSISLRRVWAFILMWRKKYMVGFQGEEGWNGNEIIRVVLYYY